MDFLTLFSAVALGVFVAGLALYAVVIATWESALSEFGGIVARGVFSLVILLALAGGVWLAW